MDITEKARIVASDLLAAEGMPAYRGQPLSALTYVLTELNEEIERLRTIESKHEALVKAARELLDALQQKGKVLEFTDFKAAVTALEEQQ